MTTILRVLAELLRAFALLMAAALSLLALAAQGGRFSDRLDVLTHFTPIWLGGLIVAVGLWMITGRRGRTTPMLALVGGLSALTLMIPEWSAASGRTGGKVDGETLKIVQFNLWGRNRDPDATARWILETDPDIVVIEEGSGPNGDTGVIIARPELGGDVVLARRDVGVAYHLAVTLDDALQGVTHVIRGRDLFEATHVQRLLQALLGLPTPVYRHHRLLTGPDGRRYAKRDHAQTLADLRAAGVTPQELRAEMGF